MQGHNHTHLGTFRVTSESMELSEIFIMSTVKEQLKNRDSDWPALLYSWRPLSMTAPQISTLLTCLLITAPVLPAVLDPPWCHTEEREGVLWVTPRPTNASVKERGQSGSVHCAVVAKPADMTRVKNTAVTRGTSHKVFSAASKHWQKRGRAARGCTNCLHLLFRLEDQRNGLKIQKTVKEKSKSVFSISAPLPKCLKDLTVEEVKSQSIKKASFQQYLHKCIFSLFFWNAKLKTCISLKPSF